MEIEFDINSVDKMPEHKYECKLSMVSTVFIFSRNECAQFTQYINKFDDMKRLTV